ncbi:hypothetical protein MPSEU_000409400 [Mayamaea pseudoterrestris]|nr:hypothetical protein MPSEU_000409400 [Mayamaea pseudoterrestris]
MSSSSPPIAVASDQTNGRGEIQQRRTHGDGKDPTVGINEATGAPDTTASSAPVGSNFGPSTSLPKSSNMPIHYQQQQHQQQHQYPVQQYQTHHGTPPLGPHHVIRTVYEDSSQHQEQQRLLLFQHQQQQAILQSNETGSRSKHGHRRHRKSLSSNAALSNGRGGAGGYGAFWGPQPSQLNQNIHTASLAPLTAGPPRHKRHGSWGHQLPAGTSLHPPPSPASAASSPKLQLGKSLDPRVNELRSLTASLGMSPRSSPKPSPVMYAASSNTVMLETHHHVPPNQLQPFLLPPAAAAAAASWDSNDTFDYQYGAPDSMGMTRRYATILARSERKALDANTCDSNQLNCTWSLVAACSSHSSVAMSSFWCFLCYS